MKLIRNDVPADAPINPHPVGTTPWAEWIENARASSDYVIIIQSVPHVRVSLTTYPLLSKYRPQIERGDVRWASLAALQDVDRAQPPEEDTP